MGWREDWSRLMKIRDILLKILELIIWLAQKLKKILK